MASSYNNTAPGNGAPGYGAPEGATAGYGASGGAPAYGAHEHAQQTAAPGATDYEPAVSHGAPAGTAHSHAHAGTAPVHENTGERAARGVKGVFAQGHGIGESLRGNINSAIDTLTGDHAKKAKDEEVARGGFREFANKEFEKKGTTDKAL